MKFSLLSVICLAVTALGHSHVHDHHDHLDSIHDHGDRELQEGPRSCGYQDPTPTELEQIDRDIRKYQKTKLGTTRNSEEVIQIDVYFHVFTSSSGQGAIPEDKVFKQMDVLNDAFAGVPASYSECGFEYGNETVTPFRFNLVHLETIADDAAYFLDGSSSDTIRAGLRKGDCSDLNIFTGQTSFLGWAYFPSSCPSGGDPGSVANNLDSINLLWSSLPDMGSTNYEEGDTATHEVGHWLGLFHTFQSGCFGGDQVADTPAELSPASGCPIGRDTCTTAGVDPIHNFMDYSYDCCMYMFTEGQSERMIAQASLYRGLEPVLLEPTKSPAPSIASSSAPTSSPSISSAPSIAPSSAPTSSPSISSAPTSCSGCLNGEIAFRLDVFTDQWNSETSWELVSDTSASIVLEGGNYTLRNALYSTGNVCIPEDCYTFTIFDSFGDGICCGWGQGYYEGYLNQRPEPAFSGGEFNSTAVHSFCEQDPCGTDCADSPLTVTGFDLGCEFLALNPDACTFPGAQSHCPLTCGNCEAFGCVDSTVSWTLGGDDYTCDMLVNLDPETIGFYCDVADGLRETCRATCNFCA